MMEETVSIMGLKKLAVSHLKRDSQLRNLILSQPDHLPRSEALVKIEVFSKLLENEFKA